MGNAREQAASGQTSEGTDSYSRSNASEAQCGTTFISGSLVGFDAEVARLQAELAELGAERSSVRSEPALGLPVSQWGADDDDPAS